MQTIILYTDGSYKLGIGGYGYILVMQSKIILGYGSVTALNSNYIELFAIKKAFDYLANQNSEKCRIKVYSDLLSAVHFFRKVKYWEDFSNTKILKKFIRANDEMLRNIVNSIFSIDITSIRFKKAQPTMEIFSMIVHELALYARTIQKPFENTLEMELHDELNIWEKFRILEKAKEIVVG